MDLGNPWMLISGAIIGLIGTALFIYGRNAQEPKCLGAGVVMCVFPMFVSSLALMWAIAGLCMLGVYVLPRAN
jgi:hypothetical protein